MRPLLKLLVTRGDPPAKRVSPPNFELARLRIHTGFDVLLVAQRFAFLEVKPVEVALKLILASGVAGLLPLRILQLTLSRVVFNVRLLALSFLLIPILF